MSVKVSVLMPVYRTKESYLRTAIESILNQTFTDFEFLILDDCPNDTREDIVKSYHDSRIKYLKNDRNLGITPSRNKLIEIAQGEYLATMDHDDISLPTRFEKQVAYLDSHKNVGVVGCLEKSFPNYIDHYYPEKNEDIKTALTCRCAISHPASMIRKSVLIENDIRYEERYSPAEDYRLWLRLMEYTDFYNIQEVLFRYRYHEHNTTHRQIDKMFYAGEELHYLAQKKHPELYKKFKKNKKYRWSFLGIKKLPFIGKTNKTLKKRLNKQSDIVLKKPILVHLHIFYPDLWPELKSYIQNIPPYPFDLYVTMVQKYPDIENDIRKTFPEAHIEVVENRGYDVGPFIHILNKINLTNYDFVIKLHTKGTKTKKSDEFRGLCGNQWRTELLSFLKDHKTFEKYLRTFQNSDLGMTGGYKLLISKDFYIGKKCWKRFIQFIFQHELPILKFSFFAGTMFLCRSNVLHSIQNLHLKITDFEVPVKGRTDSLAHIMERMFGYYTEVMGYKCANYVEWTWKQQKLDFIENLKLIKLKFLYVFCKLKCLLRFPIDYAIVHSKKADDCVNLSVCAIVKNEAPYIKEWLDYHILAGVQRFYIYDNESSDNLKIVLEPYIKSKTVIYKYYPGKKKQLPAYHNCIKKYRTKTKWLAFIDCDEFIVPIEKNSIPEFLEDYEEIPGVGINWMVFDSNGHIEKPTGGVLESYLRVHKNDQELVNHHIKSIVRPEMVEGITDPHVCKYFFHKTAVTENKVEIATALSETVSFSKIRINHYFSKSQNEYLAKINRGRADTGGTRFVNKDDYIFSDTKYDTQILTFLQKIKH